MAVVETPEKVALSAPAVLLPNTNAPPLFKVRVSEPVPKAFAPSRCNVPPLWMVTVSSPPAKVNLPLASPPRTLTLTSGSLVVDAVTYWVDTSCPVRTSPPLKLTVVVESLAVAYSPAR